jgi:hypothetical protein
MGRETQLQAFPNDWPLVRQVQSGECSGDLLQTACHYLCWLRRKQFKTDPRAYFDLEDDLAAARANCGTLVLVD